MNFSIEIRQKHKLTGMHRDIHTSTAVSDMRGMSSGRVRVVCVCVSVSGGVCVCVCVWWGVCVGVPKQRDAVCVCLSLSGLQCVCVVGRCKRVRV